MTDEPFDITPWLSDKAKEELIKWKPETPALTGDPIAANLDPVTFTTEITSVDFALTPETIEPFIVTLVNLYASFYNEMPEMEQLRGLQSLANTLSGLSQTIQDVTKTFLELRAERNSHYFRVLMKLRKKRKSAQH